MNSVIDLPVTEPLDGESREGFTQRLFDLVSALEVAAQLSDRETWPNNLSPTDHRTGVKLRVKLPQEWGYTASMLAGVIGTAPLRRLEENHTIVRFERVYYVADPSPWVESPQ